MLKCGHVLLLHKTWYKLITELIVAYKLVQLPVHRESLIQLLIGGLALSWNLDFATTSELKRLNRIARHAIATL